MQQRKWMELLANYDYEIDFHLGKANGVADALSHKERGETLSIISLRAEMSTNLLDEIKYWLVQALSNARGTNGGTGRLFIRGWLKAEVPHKSNMGSRIGELRKTILEEEHRTRYSIHLSINKDDRDLRQTYSWPNKKNDITYFMERCLTCLQVIIEHQ